MIILIALLVGSNIAWLIHDRQYEVVVTREIEAEQTAEGGGNNVLVGGDYYGDEAESSH
ncbi:MAG: hypothetical protein IKS74_05120 [Methanomicrobium sp.]|nr:hypothetical protein [Methanomicrobium sp.]